MGKHCAGVKINGTIGTISQPLKNGDMVEILVDKKRKPSIDWLGFIKTSFARSRIKRVLKIKEDNILPQQTLSVKQNIRPEKPKKIQGAVSLAGQTGIQASLAKCCEPKLGEEIRAYITKSRGAFVHKINCANFIKAHKKWPQKIIEASWSGSGKENLYSASFEIMAGDRVGLLGDVSSAISKLGINIITCETKTEEKSAKISAKVEINCRENLDYLFSRLRQIKGVTDIKKI